MELKELVGKKINKIFINDDYLKFETDKGILCYQVTGDCCSSSYFYDFFGVKRLLKNGEVVSVDTVQMDDVPESQQNDVTVAYGFRIITKDKKFDEVSSVFSFRNDSNGYYGGMINLVESIPNGTKMFQIEVDYSQENKQHLIEMKK